MELWARHLCENVQPNGVWGFSHFNLWWEQKACSLEIVGEEVGQLRLRQWIFGEKQFTCQSYMQDADKKLLEIVARAHCVLVLADETSEAILATAKSSTSQEDFKTQLLRLVEEI